MSAYGGYMNAQSALAFACSACLIFLLSLRSNVAEAGPQEFVAIEGRLSNALARYDTKIADEMWDDNFVFVAPNGHLAHKAASLANLSRSRASEAPTLTSHNDSVDVQYEDVNVAVVTVSSTWRFGTAAKADPYVATHVWVRRGKRWRLLSAQVANFRP